MEPKPTVYVVNHTGNDYSDAKRFGDVVFMSRGPYEQDELDHVLDKIKNYIGDTSVSDYLVLDGGRLLCSHAYYLWLVKHGSIKLLQFNPSFSKRCYEERRIDL